MAAPSSVFSTRPTPPRETRQPPDERGGDDLELEPDRVAGADDPELCDEEEAGDAGEEARDRERGDQRPRHRQPGDRAPRAGCRRPRRRCGRTGSRCMAGRTTSVSTRSMTAPSTGRLRTTWVADERRRRSRRRRWSSGVRGQLGGPAASSSVPRVARIGSIADDRHEDAGQDPDERRRRAMPPRDREWQGHALSLGEVADDDRRSAARRRRPTGRCRPRASRRSRRSQPRRRPRSG